ncbi:MAG: hypothetical protein AAB152_01675 [Candidatus Coatesbacteria bacterium]
MGKLTGDRGLQDKTMRLAGSDIRVETLDDVLVKAERIYGEVEKTLKKVAPEYSRQARRGRKKEKK